MLTPRLLFLILSLLIRKWWFKSPWALSHPESEFLNHLSLSNDHQLIIIINDHHQMIIIIWSPTCWSPKLHSNGHSEWQGGFPPKTTSLVGRPTSRGPLYVSTTHMSMGKFKVAAQNRISGASSTPSLSLLKHVIKISNSCWVYYEKEKTVTGMVSAQNHISGDHISWAFSLPLSTCWVVFPNLQTNLLPPKTTYI